MNSAIVIDIEGTVGLRGDAGDRHEFDQFLQCLILALVEIVVRITLAHAAPSRSYWQMALVAIIVPAIGLRRIIPDVRHAGQDAPPRRNRVRP